MDVVDGFVVRRNGTIKLKNNQQETVRSWHFKQAFPIRWVGPEFRADSSSVAFESVELVHNGLMT